MSRCLDFFDPSKCPSKWLIKLLSHKKNYVPQFLKQQDINSYYMLHCVTPLWLLPQTSCYRTDTSRDCTLHSAQTLFFAYWIVFSGTPLFHLTVFSGTPFVFLPTELCFLEPLFTLPLFDCVIWDPLKPLDCVFCQPSYVFWNPSVPLYCVFWDPLCHFTVFWPRRRNTYWKFDIQYSSRQH